MKKIIIYSCFAWLILAISSCGNGSDIPSLKETFSPKDKNPFGAYVVHNHLRQIFSKENKVVKIRTKFDDTWNSMSDTAALYICISRNLYLTPLERDAMLNYVSAGNTLFISSDNIDMLLLDTLLCATYNPFEDGFQYIRLQNTFARMKDSVFANTNPYSYFYLPLSNKFTKYDSTAYPKILGVNEYGGTNYIVFFYGKGRFYLHCEPRLFSNYFLLKNDNYQYMLDVFSAVYTNTEGRIENVYIDDFYNKRNSPVYDTGMSLTGLNYVLQHPPLAAAFWLLLLSMLLYILFNGKRRQRIIKEIPPVTNTTIAFTETVGRLYLQKKDNRNIADKMITYLFEHLRNQFFLNTNHINEEFVTALARKSGVSQKDTEELFKTIADVQKTAVVSDTQLLLLNKQIENFNKNKQ